MDLDCPRPGALGFEGHVRHQRRKASLYAIHVLGVQAEQPSLGGQGGQEVVKLGGLGSGSLAVKFADHVVERRRKAIVLVYRGIEQVFARVLWRAEGIEEAIGGAKIGDTSPNRDTGACDHNDLLFLAQEFQEGLELGFLIRAIVKWEIEELRSARVWWTLLPLRGRRCIFLHCWGLASEKCDREKVSKNGDDGRIGLRGDGGKRSAEG